MHAKAGRYFWRVARICVVAAAIMISAPEARCAGHAAPGRTASAKCHRAILEGTVRSGQGFQVEFARGFVFGLEPIPSGWALRVIAADRPRGGRDFAEVATLPYASVSPLLLSTDWAFRSQDAAGWTPRRFRYAATEGAYSNLATGYDAVVRGDEAASRRAALLSEAQPEGLFEVEDVTLAPGSANQTSMAAAVSSRFAQTPHRVDTAAPPSRLGRLEEVRFRVVLDLPGALVATKGVKIADSACPSRPTVAEVPASDDMSKRNSQ